MRHLTVLALLVVVLAACGDDGPARAEQDAEFTSALDASGLVGEGADLDALADVARNACDLFDGNDAYQQSLEFVMDPNDENPTAASTIALAEMNVIAARVYCPEHEDAAVQAVTDLSG